jgi:hypothetical protein
MLTGENKFWLDVARQVSPGWSMKAGQHADQAREALGSHDTFMYVVDASTGWIAAGSTLSSEMFRARREIQKAKLGAAVQDAAGMSILSCGERSLDADHADTQLALVGAICAATQTVTWETTIDRLGSPAGHWFWLVYKLRSGDPLGRPLFAQDQRRGFTPMENVRSAVCSALANDLGNPASAVFRKIADGGGTTLSPEVRAWCPELPAA